MNYYEEFGVAPDATTEEIRQAYRALARLVHPDVHSDERLRIAAGRQMRRINEIFDILISPEKRKSYDESIFKTQSLDPACIVPVATINTPAANPHVIQKGQDLIQQRHALIQKGQILFQKGQSSLYWIIMGSIGLAMCIWYVTAPKPSVVVLRPKITEDRSTIMPNATPSAAAEDRKPDDRKSNDAPIRKDDALFEDPDPGGVNHPRTQRSNEETRLSILEPASSSRSLTAARGTSNEGTKLSVLATRAGEDAIPAPPVRLPEATNIVSLPAVPSKSSDVSAPKAERNKWIGNWLYVPNASEPPKTQYVAEYVELTLTEQDGMLNGNYQARYRVTDRALPPEVRLRMDGRATDANAVNLHWISANGAEGESQLLLDKPDSMILNWWTVHFGTKPGLSSGTARLIRQHQH